jgi:hypothetical protein
MPEQSEQLYELLYATYNPGQYPEHQDSWKHMVADGWRILNSALNYNEVYILWHRGPGVILPEPVELTAIAGEVHCNGCRCGSEPG